MTTIALPADPAPIDIDLSPAAALLIDKRPAVETQPAESRGRR